MTLHPLFFSPLLPHSDRDLFNTNLNVRGVNEWIFGDRAAVGYGAELRMPYLLNLQFALGAAHGRIDDVDLGVEVYVRFGWGF